MFFGPGILEFTLCKRFQSGSGTNGSYNFSVQIADVEDFFQINDDTGVQATFHDLWLWTVRAAQNLLQRGFHSRQVFGFIAENSDHLVPMYLASICLACPIVPLHSTLSVNEIRNVLTKTKPSVIFCDTEAHDKLTEALNELKLNAKIFIFGEGINDSEPVENLLIETGKESDFV